MLKNKDLLGIKELSKEELLEIFNLAKDMKKKLLNHKEEEKIIKGNMTTLFYENSTRTKHSFSVAGQNVGLLVSDLGLSTSSVKKGESLYDTAVTIDQMGTDVVVMRHSSSGAAHFIAKNIKASVINAGDGTNEHPTQALLDGMTILEEKGSFEGLNVCIAGDIANSRVARSNIYALNKLGANVILTGPTTLLPKGMEQLGAKVNYNVREAVKNADVVMGLRIQLERQKSGAFPDLREYSNLFGVDEEVFSYAKPDAIIMHPGPVNRNVELSSTIIDAPYSTINKQVTNGVAVRMAILQMIMETRSNGLPKSIRKVI
ncbi:aspartate carbamoyltransferase [Natranaerovirga hydrolytica]|uniref:Aspartate carbamoyltransferase n=1 Tax=Natranaerovirga hydrolytica TaxID=680378 RepID=A0A4R1MM83_9FIRM|nr:aspartate carbamoyltransferase catalytic subunit [Natranaerovirga hydrolytica]TCK92384.1 aspartate carbamoyltransferase [Natranaerovirga hydrolytica]